MGKMYNQKEVAEMFSVSRQTIYFWMRKGILNFIRLPGKVLFPESEIERFKKENLGRRK